MRTSPAERRGEGEPSQENRKRKKKTHAPYNQSRPLNEELPPPPTPFPSPPPHTRAEALFVHTENGLEQTNQTGPQPSLPYYPLKKKKRKIFKTKENVLIFQRTFHATPSPAPQKNSFFLEYCHKRTLMDTNLANTDLSLSLSPSFSLKAKT